jgi:hypothetical protein
MKIMKTVKTFEQFTSKQRKHHLNERINYREGINADLLEVGYSILDGLGDDPDDFSEKEIKKVAIDAMKNAKPVPLTGKFKADLTAFLNYVDIALRNCGVDLDVNNTEIDSENFANELMIPVVGSDFYFNTLLDYNELAYNGSNFVIGGNFASEEVGAIGDVIDDLSNSAEVAKMCKKFKSGYLDK